MIDSADRHMNGRDLSYRTSRGYNFLLLWLIRIIVVREVRAFVQVDDIVEAISFITPNH